VPPEVRPVGQVTRLLRERLEADPEFQDLWLAGEISTLTTAGSGHQYFTLKDQAGSIRCVFFRNHNMAHRKHMEVGASLVIHGYVSVYPERGELQFVVDFVQPAGVGALQAEFERRRAQFEAEGLFDLARKRPLPRFPRRIGVVTSAQGAVFHDIQNVLERRWPLATVILQPSLVQGETAAADIADAVRAIMAQPDDSLRPEVLIVGRGGGAAEDLWAFNEEAVVRAIFGCPVPVVSAVGHETDFTLADLVADRRAPTPSAAAELVSPDRYEVSRAISSLLANNLVRVSRHLASASQDVDRTLNRMGRRLPDTAPLHRNVSLRADRMRHAVGRSVSDAREHTASIAARLRTLSPMATLERGYTLVNRLDGTPLASAAPVTPGEQVAIRWRDGTRQARVESDT